MKTKTHTVNDVMQLVSVSVGEKFYDPSRDILRHADTGNPITIAEARTILRDREQSLITRVRAAVQINKEINNAR